MAWTSRRRRPTSSKRFKEADHICQSELFRPYAKRSQPVCDLRKGLEDSLLIVPQHLHMARLRRISSTMDIVELEIGATLLRRWLFEIRQLFAD